MLTEIILLSEKARQFRLHSTKLAVGPYGGPEYRLAEQNFARFADALTKINQPSCRNSSCQAARRGKAAAAALSQMAMLSSMFGRLMPDALENSKTRRCGRGRRNKATGRAELRPNKSPVSEMEPLYCSLTTKSALATFRVVR